MNTDTKKALLFSDKIAFYPSEDIEEHPGVKIRFK